MTHLWTYLPWLFFIIGCLAGFRILLEVFCVRTERTIRLLCVSGMMLLYTAIMTFGLYFMGELLLNGVFFSEVETITLTDYRSMICALFPIVNLLLGALIIFYSSQIQKHSLNNREKILLKDL